MEKYSLLRSFLFVPVKATGVSNDYLVTPWQMR